MSTAFFAAAVLVCLSFVAYIKEIFKSYFTSFGTSEAETRSILLQFPGLLVALFDSFMKCLILSWVLVTVFVLNLSWLVSKKSIAISVKGAWQAPKKTYSCP